MTLLVDSVNQSGATWWDYMLHATWQSSLVAVLALLAVWLGRRWPAPLRYGLLVVALVKFAMPPLLALPTGLFSTAGPVAVVRPIEEAPETPIHAVPVTRAALTEEHVALSSARPAVTAAAPPAATEPLPVAKAPSEPAPSPPRPHLSWQAWLMVLHVSGATLGTLWVAVQWARLSLVVRRARSVPDVAVRNRFHALCERMNIRHAPSLLVSNEVQTPFAFGLLHPVVMVPMNALEGLPTAQVETIMAHELAHYARRDLWVNWAQIALSIPWWFNPVFWMLSRATRKAREDCCDDLLLAREITTRHAYCDVLVAAAAKMSGRPPVGAALGFAERLHPLGRRLKRIMDRSLSRSARLSIRGAILLLVLAGMLLPGIRHTVAEVVKTDDGPLKLTLIGVCPDAGDQVYDREGNPIDVAYMPNGGQWNADDQYVEVIFDVEELPEDILFSRFMKIRVSDTDRQLGGVQNRWMAAVDGRWRLLCSLTLDRTYKEPGLLFTHEYGIDRVDLTSRYYTGPRREAGCTFEGPFDEPRHATAGNGAPCVLTPKEDDRRRNFGEPTATFRVASPMDPGFDSNFAVVAYDREGRRYLGQKGSGRRGPNGMSAEIAIAGISLDDIATVTFDEPPQTTTVRNIVIRPADCPFRDYPVYEDRIAARLGTTREALAQSDFQLSPEDTIKVFDLLRGNALRHLKNSMPHDVDFSDLDPETKQRIRETAWRFATESLNPSTASLGIQAGLKADWPEFFDLAMDVLGPGPRSHFGLRRTTEGRWFAPGMPCVTWNAGLCTRIARSTRYCGDLTRDEAFRLVDAIKVWNTETFYYLMFLLLEQQDTVAVEALHALAQDAQPQVWFAALAALDQRKLLPAAAALSPEVRDRVTLFATLVSKDKNERVPSRLVPLLASVYTTDFINTRHAELSPCDLFGGIAKHCDLEMATDLYIGLLKSFPETDLRAGRYSGRVARVVRWFNFEHSVNIAELGSDFQAEMWHDESESTDWARVRQEAVTWHEAGSLPEGHAPEPMAELVFPEDRSMGRLDTLGPYGALEARARISLPRSLFVDFAVDPSCADFSALKQLAPFRAVSLDLSNTSIKDADLRHISGLDSLRKLDLGGRRISDAGVRMIEALTGLEYLRLHGTGITDEGLASLAHLTRLKGLMLEGTVVTDAGLAHLARLTSLGTLDLSRTKITDSGVKHLLGMQKLGVLRLAHCAITDASLERLKTLPRLRAISLEGTRVTDAGLAHLKDIPSPGQVFLGGTGITDAGLMHLAQAKGLVGLDLNETSVGDEGVRHISQLPALVWLSLDDTAVTERGIEHLQTLPKLDSLYLRGCSLTDAAVPALKQLRGVHTLRLADTQLTPAGFKELQEALPNCTIQGAPK